MPNYYIKDDEDDKIVEKLKEITEKYFKDLAHECWNIVLKYYLSHLHLRQLKNPQEQDVLNLVDTLYSCWEHPIFDEHIFLLNPDDCKLETLNMIASEKGFKLLVDKLKIVADLKDILEPSLKSSLQKRSNQQSGHKITLFKSSIVDSHKGLDNHRNTGWDAFYNLVSVIIFPIAIARSLNSLYQHGTCHFMWTRGHKMLQQSENILKEMEANKKSRNTLSA